MALERLELLITSTGTSAAKGILAVGAASEEAAAKQTLMQRASDGAGQAINKLSGGLIPVESGFKAAAAAGGALAAVGIAKFALDGVEKFASLTGEVRGFQRVAGTSAEDSSKLNFAVKELGISPDIAASAFGRLATRIGTGKATMLEHLGIIQRNKDGTLDLAGTVANLSEQYQKTGDAGEKAALGNAAFGRSWQSMAALLGKGKEDLQAIYEEAGKDHQIFSQADLEKGRQFTAATRELHAALEGLAVEAGSALAPAVTQGTQAFTGSIQAADSLTSGLGGLGNTVGMLINNINPLNPAMHAVSAGSDLMAGHFADAGKNALEAIPGIGGYIGGLFGTDQATNTLADSQQRAQTAWQNYNNAVIDHGKHSREARDAQHELRDATGELQTAQEKAAPAIDSFNRSLQTQSEKAAIAQTGLLGIAGATLSVEGNGLATADAMDIYNATLYANGAAGDVSEQAQRRLEQAHIAVVKAAIATILSAGDLALANYHGSDASEAARLKAQAQRDAYNELTDKIPGLRLQLQGTAADINAIPTSHNTVVTVDTSDAFNNLSGLRSEAQATWDAITHAKGAGSSGGGDGGYHGPPLYFSSKGGFVPGTGNGDTVPAMLTPGEFVVSKDMMKGGHGMPGGMGSPTHITVQSVLDGKVIAASTFAIANRAGGPKLLPSAIIDR